MAYETLTASTDARGVMTISLNRPEIRNAFNDVLIQELTSIFEGDASQA